MSSPEASEKAIDEDPSILIAALNHAWAWYDAQFGRSFQLVNYYLIAEAVLLTAYVGAITARQYLFATMAALLAGTVTAAAYVTGLQTRRLAKLGQDALADVQDRVADQLGIDSLRMARKHALHGMQTITLGFAIGIVVPLAAALYAITR